MGGSCRIRCSCSDIVVSYMNSPAAFEILTSRTALQNILGRLREVAKQAIIIIQPRHSAYKFCPNSHLQANYVSVLR